MKPKILMILACLFGIFYLLSFQESLADGEAQKISKKDKKKSLILVVFIHKQKGVEKLSPSQVRSIFLKKIKGWKIYDRKSKTSEKKHFLEYIIKKSQQEWQDYWIQQRIQKGIFAPPAYKKDYTVLNLVSRKKKGISYMYKKNLEKKKFKKYRKKIQVVLEIKIKEKS